MGGAVFKFIIACGRIKGDGFFFVGGGFLAGMGGGVTVLFS